MEMAATDALDEGLLLFRIGELEIGGKASGDRERLILCRSFCARSSGLPPFIAPDAERAGVRRLRGACGAVPRPREDPPPVGRMSWADNDCDPVGVREKEQGSAQSVGML